jgi:hypothetical protein
MESHLVLALKPAAHSAGVQSALHEIAISPTTGWILFDIAEKFAKPVGSFPGGLKRAAA